jgi:UDP-N-acetylmuramate--alanine ligase
MPGQHNALNALLPSPSPMSSAIRRRAISAGLAGFSGVKRRFSRTANVERRADLRRLRPSPGRDRCRARRRARASTGASVIAVVQPHRYTRLRDRCSPTSPPASTMRTAVIVATLYSCRRAAYRRASIAIRSWRHPRARATAQCDDHAARAADKLVPAWSPPAGRPGRLWSCCLGAGNITQWAYALPNGCRLRLGSEAVSFADITAGHPRR